MAITRDRVQCPECEEGKKKAQVFYNEEYDSYSAYCFVHSKLIKNPYGSEKPPAPKVKSPEDIAGEIREIKELPVLDFKFRDIPAAVYRSWGVRLAKSEEDGKTPFAVYYPYTFETKLIGWKARNIVRKAFWAVGSTKGADPFGWNKAMKAGGRKIYITEGEQDAIALDYALTLVQSKTKFKGTKNAIISLPSGVDSVARTLKLVGEQNWKEVVLVFDTDEAGQEAVKAAQKINRDVLVGTMPFGCKDANEAVSKGLIKELFQGVYWDAKKPPIKGVVQVSDIIGKVTEKPVMGLSYPMADLTKMTYGQNMGEVVGIGAGVSLGKTLLMHEFGAHNIIVHDAPIFVVALEESNQDTLRNIAGKIDSTPYHRPDAVYDMDKFMSTANSLQGKLLMWGSDEDQGMRFDIEEIIKAIRFNVAEYGVRFVDIDNMTCLIDHLSPAEGNEFINKYSSELAGLAAQLEINIKVFSHLNKPYKGQDHESGGKALLSQFTGSRGMMRAFPSMLAFERNKHAKGLDSSKSAVVGLKFRKYGGERAVKTRYIPETGRLIEDLWSGDNILETFTDSNQ